MAGFTDLGVEMDEDELVQEAFAYMQAVFPSWTPNEAHPEVALIEEFCSIAAETAVVASNVGKDIFRQFGRQLIGLEPRDGTQASAVTRWTAVDTLGYIIRAGTQVGYSVTGDQIYSFAVDRDYEIRPGEIYTDGVVIMATEVGVDANGLSAQELVVIDALTWVSLVESTNVSTGGSDSESDDSYLSRLRQEMTLLAPRPIVARDFAAIARRVPGVHRAKALDTYDPTDNTYGNARVVTIVPVSADGRPCSEATKLELQQFLDERREINFVINIVDPSYLPIHVIYTAIAFPGEDPAEIHAEAKENVEQLLDPASFGGGSADPPEWRHDNIVYFWEVVAALNAVEGLDRVTALTVNGVTNQDIALFEPAGLPAPLGPNLVIDTQVQGAVSLPEL